MWRFQSRCEYLTVGTKIIFREGTTKGMGEVTKILPFEGVDSDEAKSENLSYKSIKKRLSSPPEEKKRFKKTDQVLVETNNREIIES